MQPTPDVLYAAAQNVISASARSCLDTTSAAIENPVRLTRMLEIMGIPLDFNPVATGNVLTQRKNDFARLVLGRFMGSHPDLFLEKRNVETQFPWGEEQFL